jgi:hypothetical protein
MSFAGRWMTSFGPMTLRQDGSQVRGSYGRSGTENTIEGTVEGGRLAFRYKEAQEHGTGWFRLRRPGSFGGEYLAEGNPRTLPWQGWRDFDGLWDTSIGRLRLVQEDGQVTGTSEWDTTARIEGIVEQSPRLPFQEQRVRLPFQLQAAKVKGRGVFELDATGYMLSGEWAEEGQPAHPLAGQRAMPQPGLTWLVVLEAHWQRSLDDNEFAFGHMLRELFARLPRALVRHRFYHDEASLLHWCRQLLYLPEPSVLVITGHGETTGLTVGGKIIALSGIIDSLRLADGLKLLHFSSCLVGQDAGQALREAPFPVSGYTTSVDWAQSALTEFIYLDMILEKGLSPGRAAEELLRLVRFAGTEDLPGSPYRPAGFCFVGPDGGLAQPTLGPVPAA